VERIAQGKRDSLSAEGVGGHRGHSPGCAYEYRRLWLDYIFFRHMEYIDGITAVGLLVVFVILLYYFIGEMVGW
jgi:hypothetical protein